MHHIKQQIWYNIDKICEILFLMSWQNYQTWLILTKENNNWREEVQKYNS